MPAYRIRTVFTGVPGAPYMSNFYFDAGVVGDASSAANATYTFWNAVDAYMTTACSWTIDNDVPLFTNPDTIAGWETVIGGSGAGSQSDEAMPQSNQILVQWSTGVVFNNRRIRGRTFVPALTQQSNFAGAVLPTVATAIETAATALVGEGLTIASRAANTFNQVTAADVWTQFAVLRSRRD